MNGYEQAQRLPRLQPWVPRPSRRKLGDEQRPERLQGRREFGGEVWPTEIGKKA